jgi:methylated-DNA-[protein]-cysteine S-methyltransferase
MRTFTIVDSPIGDLTLVNTDGVLSGLWMEIRAPGRPDASGERTRRGFEQAERELAEYFAGDRRAFDLATAAHGDRFQRRVWALLRRIPFGGTRSYGELARELGDVGLSRAVGVANARNPIAIVVPCHRVIGSDGSLKGYAGGVERKRFLLDLEAAAAGATAATGATAGAALTTLF